MNNLNPVATYALRLGDNGLVLAQRLGAWCGHAPELEIDLALANIGLDLLGQSAISSATRQSWRAAVTKTPRLRSR